MVRESARRGGIAMVATHAPEQLVLRIPGATAAA
jgi:hypothetical protein